jgi:P4 family phage/plasmid primase-like protien
LKHLYDDFRLNVAEYPGLVDILAASLEVTADSLDRLGVGFDPTMGVWTFPEYDESRNLIGLIRRYPDGKKYCVEGSKRGLALDVGHELTDDPILVVEGHSDAAAALDLGCQVVGRPSATGGFDKVIAMTEGRTVLVVGENDDGVGITSASALTKKLTETCKSVSSVLPPPEYKDLRQWVHSGTITKDELEGYCDGGSVKPHGILELKYPEIRAIDLATYWLRHTYWRGELPLLRNYRGDWYVYNGQYYVLADEDEAITASVHQLYQTTKIARPNTKGTGIEIKPVDISISRLNSIKKALLAPCAVPTPPPCWFGLSDIGVADLIPFHNGYLQAGDWSFHPPTPELFITATLPYRYDSEAACPRWMSFLQEVFPDDPLKHTLLQEWMGYLLVPDTRYEKFILFLGPSGGGKSTAINAMMSMLGPDITTAFSMQDVGYRFGLHKFIGKQAAFAGDAHITKGSDSYRIVELIKAITGQDAIAVDRKFKDESTVKIHARLTIAANELPDLPDDASALRRRMLILPFTESFIDEPDPHLKDTLHTEAPGICVWALEGLKRLREQGAFTEPKSLPGLLREIERVNSPIRAFVDECCIVSADAEVAMRVLYACWGGYRKESHQSSLGLGRFEQKLRTAVPGITSHVREDGVEMYRGISLRQDAEARYVRY